LRYEVQEKDEENPVAANVGTLYQGKVLQTCSSSSRIVVDLFADGFRKSAAIFLNRFKHGDLSTAI
jgi:hypothetical protein